MFILDFSVAYYIFFIFLHYVAITILLIFSFFNHPSPWKLTLSATKRLEDIHKTIIFLKIIIMDIMFDDRIIRIVRVMGKIFRIGLEVLGLILVRIRLFLIIRIFGLVRMRMMSGEDGNEVKKYLIKKLIKKSSWLAVSHILLNYTHI